MPAHFSGLSTAKHLLAQHARVSVPAHFSGLSTRRLRAPPLVKSLGTCSFLWVIYVAGREPSVAPCLDTRAFLWVVYYAESYTLFPLPKLQSSQSVCKLLITLLPPLETGLMWSTCSLTPSLADLPHMTRLYPSRLMTS